MNTHATGLGFPMAVLCQIWNFSASNFSEAVSFDLNKPKKSFFDLSRFVAVIRLDPEVSRLPQNFRLEFFVSVLEVLRRTPQKEGLSQKIQNPVFIIIFKDPVLVPGSGLRVGVSPTSLRLLAKLPDEHFPCHRV